jgi:hypothetical protein
MSDLNQYEVALEQTSAPAPELSDAEMIASVLEDHNVIADAALVFRLDALIDTAAFARAGEALRHTLSKMPARSAAAAALRRVLLGDGEPLRECAKRCRVSHVAIHKQEKRIRKSLKG